jgi:hypothetical protein
MSSFRSVHHPNSESYGGVSDAMTGTSVDSGGTTQSGDTLMEVSSASRGTKSPTLLWSKNMLGLTW